MIAYITILLVYVEDLEEVMEDSVMIKRKIVIAIEKRNTEGDRKLWGKLIYIG